MIIKLNICKVKVAYMDKGDMKFAEMAFPKPTRTSEAAISNIVKGKYGHNAMATAVEINERQFDVPEEVLAKYEISDAPNAAE